MKSHENHMKKDNIKTTYILTINFKPELTFEEKAQFIDVNERS